MSWHWIDVTASIFPAKCGEFLRNIVKTKHLRSYFCGFFLLFPTIVDFRKFSFSDIQVFYKSVLSAFCDSPVSGVSKSIVVTWRVVFLLQLHDCFSDEQKERFFPVWTDVINICVGPRGQFILVHRPQEDTYTCHCKHVLDETLQGPNSALCVSYIPMQHLSPISIMVFLQQFNI